MSNLNELCNIFIEKLQPIVNTDIIIKEISVFWPEALIQNNLLQCGGLTMT